MEPPKNKRQSRWNNSVEPSTSAASSTQPFVVNNAGGLPNLMNVSLPQLTNQSHSQQGILAPPGTLHSLLGAGCLLKGPPTPQQMVLPPAGISPASLGALFPPPPTNQHKPQPPPSNFMPNPLLTQQSIELLNILGGAQHKNATPFAGLSNAFFEQFAKQQQSALAPAPFTAPLPPRGQPLGPSPALITSIGPPFLPPGPSSIGPPLPLMVPPPPPPPASRNPAKCAFDSPMDIEDEDHFDNQASEKEVGNARGDDGGKGRSKNVQLADELMKSALKPYFARRKISKEEYKEIMKKGVAKLRKRNSLRTEKVEKFVARYVQSISLRRRSYH